MIHHRFEGDDATKILKFILPTNKNGSEFLDIPNSWIQSLVFMPNTHKLCQNKSGPCGLFAVLQAYILAILKFDPDYNPQEALHDAILEIMLKLRQVYAFCTDFKIGTNNSMNSSHRFIDIQITSSKEVAKDFLNNSKYISIENVTFLLMISFAFLAGPKLLSTFSFQETFITKNGMTDVHFVFLLLTGRAVDIPSDDCKIIGGILCSGVKDQQQIGFLSIADDLSEPIGNNLTYPLYEVWVVHYGGHFTALARNDKKFVEYNNFNSRNNFRILDTKHTIWNRLNQIAKHIDENG